MITTVILSVLLFVWVFFIPSSLGFHYQKQLGLVNGILVDYRIPTVTINAILCLLFFFCLLLSMLLRKTIHWRVLCRTLFYALASSILFQSIVSFLQLFTQHSVFGYLPFGEVDYSSTQIVLSTFFDGALKKLPYGTTTHPNVLAGFVVISSLLCLLLQRKKWMRFPLIFIALLLCCSTQSLNALAALIVGAVLFFTIPKHIVPTRIVRISILLTPIISIFFFSLPLVLHSQNPSLLRRAQLEQITFRMIDSHPITGIGWNTFTLHMEEYGFVTSTIRFLQPVHNIFLLVLAETGVMGWTLLLLYALFLQKIHSKYLYLFAALTILGSLDHYLLSLATGRLMLLVCFLAIFIDAHQEEKRYNMTAKLP